MSRARQAQNPQPAPVAPWRWWSMLAVVAALFAVLVWRVLGLQVLDTAWGHEFLQGQGADRYVRIEEIPAYRGIITDRRGEPLAVSAPVVSLWADPAELLASGKVAELAAALGLDEVALNARLASAQGRGSAFMFLRRHIPPTEAQRVTQLGIAGVHDRLAYQRYYPAGEVASHLVGMTDIDNQGIEGMELASDRWLRGTPGRKRVIKDARRKVTRDIGELRAAEPGRDLRLSIDLRLQYLAHRELQRAVATSGARAGTVVTLDARSGEVLALVNHPTYNPNSRKGLRQAHVRNRALTDLFEPGSTMKPLTLVAALASGQFTPASMIDTAPGHIRVDGKVLLDPVDYGHLSVAEVIAKSSQVGIVKMALPLGEDAFRATFRQFGLGEYPGTGFRGELAGMLPREGHWRPIEKATLAYGYGLAVTPLQLARAYAVIASGGRLLTPSLHALDPGPVAAEQVLDPALAGQVLAVLRSTTEPGGTARRARIRGYSVAGKTGTVHKKAKEGGASYADDRYLALFAGIAPAARPRLVTVVLIDEPQGDRYYGGEVAAPVFAAVTAGVLRLLNVAPDLTPAPVLASGAAAGAADVALAPGAAAGAADVALASGRAAGAADVALAPGRAAGAAEVTP